MHVNDFRLFQLGLQKCLYQNKIFRLYDYWLFKIGLHAVDSIVKLIFLLIDSNTLESDE
jgi:hypothetical protein